MALLLLCPTGIDTRGVGEVDKPQRRHLTPNPGLFRFGNLAVFPLGVRGAEFAAIGAGRLHDWTAVVTRCGGICYQRRKINLSQVFAGQKVGVKQTAEHIWLVSFMDYDLGYFDESAVYGTSAFLPISTACAHLWAAGTMPRLVFTRCTNVVADNIAPPVGPSSAPITRSRSQGMAPGTT